MSKETEPIRSRRELREQSAQAADAVVNPAVPEAPAQETVEVAVAAQAPAEQAPRGERESQTRARDRAALRAYQELVDPPAMNPLPSRRALRQAQLDADRAPLTSVNPVVAVAATPPVGPPAPERKPTAAAAPAQTPAPMPMSAQAPVAAEPKQAADVAQPAAKVNVTTDTAAPTTPAVPATLASAAPATVTPTPVASAARARSGRRAATPTSPTPLVLPPETVTEATKDSANQATSDAVLSQTAAASEEKPNMAAAAQPNSSTVATPVNSSKPGPTAGSNGKAAPAVTPLKAAPSEEELQKLTAQKAEADREAILNQRAQVRERLAQESAKSKRQAVDPTATNNLAMVTPLEFIEVPGSSQSVMRPPTTTHVPIVTRATTRTTPPRPEPALAATDAAKQGTAAKNPTVPSVTAERFDAALAARAAHRPGPGNRPLTGGRSSTLKQAEAMVTSSQPKVTADVGPVEVQRSQMPPMPADYAHGLEPLDAMTAGLGRTQRNLLIQWGSILVGGIALVVGAIMFFTA